MPDSERKFFEIWINRKEFIYCLVKGEVHAWCPFGDVNTTPEVLASGFPLNVLALLITAICWGCILIYFVYWNAL